MGRLFCRSVAVGMRTIRAAGLGAGAQRLVDDGLDGARAAAAFGTAAEAAIHLLGISCHGPTAIDGIADIVVAEDVTGTDNHRSKAGSNGDASQYGYCRLLRDAKGKSGFCSNSKLMRDSYWNESKSSGPAFRDKRSIRPFSRANPGFHRHKHRFTAATSLCVARYAKSCKHLDANTAASFIDHSSGIWNPEGETDRPTYAVPAPVRKVRS